MDKGYACVMLKSRSHTFNVLRVAAYQAGARVVDERTGEVFDQRHRDDVAWTQVVLPTGPAARDLQWACDRSRLWSAVQHAGNTEPWVVQQWLLILPVSLGLAIGAALAHGFAGELADTYRTAVDASLHGPGTERHSLHAHLLMPGWRLTPQGLAEYVLSAAHCEAPEHRQRWETLVAGALRAAATSVVAAGG
jgi:hypothetical protein